MNRYRINGVNRAEASRFGLSKAMTAFVRNGPESVKGAPLLGAAKRTLDGEDRSEMIAEEGKAGAKDWRKVGRHIGTLARRL
jgi:hypothetical protein